MTLSDNLPHAQQATTWRADLQRLRAVDGWALDAPDTTPLLVPVQGKNPGFDGTGWQHRRHSVEALAANDRATGVGLMTGPQPTGDSVVVFDFDGLPGVQFAFDQGIDPTAATTWTVARTDADGADTPGRFKLLFRPTAEQRARLTDTCGYSLALEAIDLGDGRSKREGLELWHSPAKQMVILGDHPDGGRYYWPTGRGPEALAPLPDAWMQFALAVIEAVVQGRCVDEAPTAKQARTKAWGSTKEWRRMKRGEACPICGRTGKASDGGKGSTHTCAWLADPSRDREVIRCFDGFTFSYRAAHPGLQLNDTILGGDGRRWYFSSERHADGFGMRGNFREHRDRQPSLPPETGVAAIDGKPQQQNGSTLIDALLQNHGNGHTHTDTPNFVHEVTGQAEAPAGQATIDLLPVVLPGNITPDTVKAAARLLVADVDPGPDPSAAARLSIDGPGPGRDAALERLALLAQQAGKLDARAGTATAVTTETVLAILQGCTKLVGRAAGDPVMESRAWKRLAEGARASEITMLARDRDGRDSERAAQGLAVLLGGWQGGPVSPGRSWVPIVAGLGLRQPPTDQQGKPKRMTTGELRQAIREMGTVQRARGVSALRWNLIRSRIEYISTCGTVHELDPQLVDTLHTNLCEAGWECGKDQAIACLLSQAREDSYNPVADYLDTLAADPNLQPIPPEQVAELILGVTDPLQQTFVAKWLIAAIARAMNPGCKVDTMLVLQGDQGQGKSTFFALLPPNPKWHTNDASSIDRDQKLLYHCVWVYEHAELDGVTTRKEADVVKREVSTPVDRIRPPYGTAEREMPRPSVMGGTCNRTDFLTDATGSRRFWVVDLRETGCTQERVERLLPQHRDAILLGALLAWRSGQPWHLSSEQEQLRAEQAEQFTPENTFVELIAAWAANLEAGAAFRTATALVNSGAVRDAIQAGGRREADRGAAALRTLGWELVPRKVDGASAKLWVRAGRPKNIRLVIVPMQLPGAQQPRLQPDLHRITDDTEQPSAAPLHWTPAQPEQEPGDTRSDWVAD